MEILPGDFTIAIVVGREAQEQCAAVLLRCTDQDIINLISGQPQTLSGLYQVVIPGEITTESHAVYIHHHQLWGLVFQALLQIVIGIPGLLHTAPAIIGGDAPQIPEEAGIHIHTHVGAAQKEHVHRILGQIIKMVDGGNPILILKAENTADQIQQYHQAGEEGDGLKEFSEKVFHILSPCLRTGSR